MDEFLALTPRQFFNAVGGFVDKEEAKIKESWEQTRLIITVIQNKPVYGYKNRVQDAKKILPLPWDTEKVKIDKEEIESVKDAINAMNNGFKDSSEFNSGN